jgi:hypothetical protein
MYKTINRGWQGKQVSGFSASRRNNSVKSSDIIRSGLFSYYDFGNGLSYSGSGTTVNDLSGNGFTATLANSPTFSTVNGGVETFNSTSQIANSSPTATAVTALTWIAWIYRNGNTPSYGGINMGRGALAANVAGIGFRDLTNQITYTWGTTALNYNFVSSLTPPLKQWCQVAACVDTSGGTLYLNNQAINNTTTNAGITYSNVSFGGDRTFTNRGANCTIALVMTYTRKLSASEISQTFEMLRPRFGI